MNYAQAEAAISAILAAVYDDCLPEPDSIDQDNGSDYGPTVWFGGKGYIAGSARDGHGNSLTGSEKRRRDAAYEAMCLERVHRVEVALLPEPSDPRCADHKPVQHRDARPSWCNSCGLTASFEKPVGRLDQEPGGSE